MKKKLLVLLSLLSAMTVAAFGATACAKDDSSEEASSSVVSVSEDSKESSEDVSSEEASSEDSSEVSSEDSSEESSSEEDTTPSLTISEKTLAVDLYSNATLTAELKNSEEALVWTSSDESIVKVVDGVVTAYKAGTATITVSAGEVSDTCEVTVAESTTAPVFAELPETITLIKGTSETLDVTLTYNDEAFTLATVTVATEGDKLSISEEYEVTGVEYGEQTITVTASIGEDVVASASIAVNVIEYGTLVVDLPENHLDMAIGDEGYALSNITAQVNGVSVENPVFTVVSDNEDVVKESDGKLVAVAAGEASVVVSFATDMATYDTTITVTVVKLQQSLENNFFVKGDGAAETLKTKDTGNALIDLSAEEIDLSQVWQVLCNDTEVVFTTEGSTLTLNNAPAGDQTYTLVTDTVDYILEGCIYTYTISTVEELLDWRENASNYYAYTVLTNDIDMGGIELPSGRYNLHAGTLDGRGYTISNFSYTKDFGFMYYISEGAAIRNVQFINVVQDCTGADGAVKVGIFGDNLMGTIENILLKQTIKNMPEGLDHYGMLSWYFSATGVAKNIVVYAEAIDCAPHYFYCCAAGGMDGCTIDNVHFVSVGTGIGISNKITTNSGAYTSEASMLTAVDFSTWKGWQTTESGAPYMSDYSDELANTYVGSNGSATLGATITFNTTSFYPLTYALAEETTGVSINENNELVIGSDATIGTTFTVNVTCADMPTYSKALSFTIEREAVEVEGVMLAQSNGTKWDYNTGTATFDFTDKGIDLTNVSEVLIDGVAFEGYSVDGNKLVLTNAPGGDHIYTINTPSVTYAVKGCVYVVGISTVEELEEWRTTESYWYAVLLNDIDYEGATLEKNGANVLGTLDGRGYKIKNFTAKKDCNFINRLYAAESAIKNIYFENVTQDCSGWVDEYVTHGILGQWNNGTIENIYLDVTTKSVAKEHLGVLCYGMDTGSHIKNVVVDIKSDTDIFHYAMNANNATTTVGVVGAFEQTKGSTEGGASAPWGVNSGFHQKLSWMIAEEANDELKSFTSAYWVIDTTARTITMKPW